MVKFVRWLRALAHWMRSVPVKSHYWWALGILCTNPCAMWLSKPEAQTIGT